LETYNDNEENEQREQEHDINISSMEAMNNLDLQDNERLFNLDVVWYSIIRQNEQNKNGFARTLKRLRDSTQSKQWDMYRRRRRAKQWKQKKK
jgi:hypothetical protein